jgi:hypothetical protein
MTKLCKYVERQEEEKAPMLCNKFKEKIICAGQKYCHRTGRMEMSERVIYACKYYRTV